MNTPLVIAALLTVTFQACAQEADSYDEMLDDLYSHTVTTISASELDSLGTGNYLILDAREEEEYAVSHLAGALNIGYEDADWSVLDDVDAGQPIVVYCSVGYRSEKIGDKLQRRGFVEVYNLYGGVFSWVNEGHPVVDGSGEETEQVHAYDEDWGKWLIKGEKVYE